MRGSLVEGRAHLDQALDLPGENALDGYRAAALARAGDLARRCGDLAGASGRFHESLRIWQELGNGFEEASVHTELGCLALARADYPEARRQLGQSLAMQRGADDQPGMARSLLCQAAVARNGLIAADRCQPRHKAQQVRQPQRLVSKQMRKVSVHAVLQLASCGRDCC